MKHIADVVLNIHEKTSGPDLVVIADRLQLRLHEAYELVVFAKTRDTYARRIWMLCERSELLATHLVVWLIKHAHSWNAAPYGLPRNVLDLPFLRSDLRNQLTERVEDDVTAQKVLPWRHPQIRQGLFALLDEHELPVMKGGSA